MTTATRTHIMSLVDYVQDSQAEAESYEDWCREQDRDPYNYAANTDHIYAVAQLVRIAMSKGER